MDRRQFLGSFGSGIIAALATGDSLGAAQPQRKRKPVNILWLICEDVSRDFACYGTKAVNTPCIDKFAAQGVIYDNACATSPVCSPSRSAFNTGMYQMSIGAHHHRSHRWDNYKLPDPVRLVSEYFHRAGYFTCNCTENWDEPGKTDFNFHAEKPFDGTNWEQRKNRQPFFAQVNFTNFDHSGIDRENPIATDEVELPGYVADDWISRRELANYLERIQLLDRRIGKVLKRLDDTGEAENTAVFLFGDNGRQYFRGMQFLYEGGIGVPLIVRWPGWLKAGCRSDELVSLLDLAPASLSIAGIKPPPHMQGQVVIGPEKTTRDYIFAARDRCDETFDRIRCVRDKRFKYIRNFYPQLSYTQPNLYKKHFYPTRMLMQVLYAQGRLSKPQERFMRPHKPVEELYDLKNDPDELQNLAKNPDFTFLVKRLSKQLDDWIERIKDRGAISEDPSVAAKWYTEVLLPRHRRVLAQRGLNRDINPAEYLQWWRKELARGRAEKQ